MKIDSCCLITFYKTCSNHLASSQYKFVPFLALHMHRTSLLYYSPQFVGENNISLKSNGDGL
jgi:hypothetical protein